MSLEGVQRGLIYGRHNRQRLALLIPSPRQRADLCPVASDVNELVKCQNAVREWGELPQDILTPAQLNTAVRHASLKITTHPSTILHSSPIIHHPSSIHHPHTKDTSPNKPHPPSYRHTLTKLPLLSCYSLTPQLSLYLKAQIKVNKTPTGMTGQEEELLCPRGRRFSLLGEVGEF